MLLKLQKDQSLKLKISIVFIWFFAIINIVYNIYLMFGMEWIYPLSNFFPSYMYYIYSGFGVIIAIGLLVKSKIARKLILLFSYLSIFGILYYLFSYDILKEMAYIFILGISSYMLIIYLLSHNDILKEFKETNLKIEIVWYTILSVMFYVVFTWYMLDDFRENKTMKFSESSVVLSLSKNKEVKMDKILISKFNAKHNIPWAIHDIVEILLKENVNIDKINKDAVVSYWILELMRNFSYSGYAGFIFEIKEKENLEKDIFRVLKVMGASKHLKYMIRQKKVYQSLSDEEKKQFIVNKHYGYIDKNLFKKVAGDGFKKIAQDENLDKLHVTWLKSLRHLEVVSFEEKYTYLSKIVGKNIMKIDKKSKAIYNFLLSWDKDKEIFDLMYLNNMEVFGEIKKFYWKEWVHYVDDIDEIHDEFYSFAVDGAGGHYLLWYYPGIDKEPPVVYFSSEGEREFLAETFSEFILTMPNIGYSKNIQDYLIKLQAPQIDEDTEDSFYDLFQSYEEEKKQNLSEKIMIKLLKKDIEKYLQLANKKFSYTKHNLEERQKFEELSKKLEGTPSILDYAKAVKELSDIFTDISHTK